MTQPVYEVNFDGLIGPTHNYAGLSRGNIASKTHEGVSSNPKQAALEGLAKMKQLADLGLRQAVLPPQDRPDIRWLKRLGFEGSDRAVLERAWREAPELLAAACSASSMWAANAATVSPSADTADGCVHFTPANLISHPHRSIESEATTRVLRTIFSDPDVFVHHPPLPPSPSFGDEGAANHTRLFPGDNQPGIELFVYGRVALNAAASGPSGATRFPARQTREASCAVARLHRLNPGRMVFVQQNPTAIDAGVFHNDVIAVGHRNVLLYHSEAFIDTSATIDDLRKHYARVCSGELICIEVTPQQLSLADAVSTYLFNSQLVTLPDGGMLLVCPIECKEHEGTQRVLDRILASDNPIGSILFVDVRQSMKNGGGPACLRLRVTLTQEQIARTKQGVFFNDQLYKQLTDWVGRHYRDRIDPQDLADPRLLDESRAALDELTGILGLGALYPFQRDS